MVKQFSRKRGRKKEVPSVTLRGIIEYRWLYFKKPSLTKTKVLLNSFVFLNTKKVSILNRKRPGNENINFSNI